MITRGEEPALVTAPEAAIMVRVRKDRLRKWVSRHQLEPVACEVETKSVLFSLLDVQRTYSERRQHLADPFGVSAGQPVSPLSRSGPVA